MKQKADMHEENKIKVTSKDVAREAGTSQATVSYVLNNRTDVIIKEETRQRVLEAARKLNYQVNYTAKMMKSNKAFAIGIASKWMGESNVFHAVINAAKVKCEQDDTALLICSGVQDALGMEDYIRHYQQGRIDGLLFLSYINTPIEELERIRQFNIPFVCVKGPRDYAHAPIVDVDYYSEGYQLGEHLVAQGYRKIAFLADHFEYERMDYAWQLRYSGLKDAIGKCEDALMLNGQLEKVINSNRTEPENIEIAMRFLQSHDVDAVVDLASTCNSFLHAAKRLGIQVPQQLGVAAYDDDIDIFRTDPTITAMKEQFLDEVSVAYEILKAKIDGKPYEKNVSVPPVLKEMQSTQRNAKI